MDEPLTWKECDVVGAVIMEGVRMNVSDSAGREWTCHSTEDCEQVKQEEPDDCSDDIQLQEPWTNTGVIKEEPPSSDGDGTELSNYFNGDSFKEELCSNIDSIKKEGPYDSRDNITEDAPCYYNEEGPCSGRDDIKEEGTPSNTSDIKEEGPYCYIDYIKEDEPCYRSDTEGEKTSYNIVSFKEEPCSSSDGEVDGPTVRRPCNNKEEYNPAVDHSAGKTRVTIPTYIKKTGHKRNYHKVDYCRFCRGSFGASISSHYENMHKEKDEVKHILALPINSLLRKKEWMKLRNEGNYCHNVQVIKEGTGELVLYRRPSGDAKRVYHAWDFVPCEFCLAFIFKDSLWQHIRHCLLKPECEQPEVRKSHVQAPEASQQDHPEVTELKAEQEVTNAAAELPTAGPSDVPQPQGIFKPVAGEKRTRTPWTLEENEAINKCFIIKNVPASAQVIRMAKQKYLCLDRRSEAQIRTKVHNIITGKDKFRAVK